MTDRSDDEQLEALKNWWRENGKSTVLIIAGAIALVFGYQAWDQQRERSRDQASTLYQNLLTADAQARQGEDTDTARHLARTLREEFPRSGYARFGALFEARYALEASDVAEAEEALEWALRRGERDGVGLLARLRLAQLLHARGEHQAALDRLEGVEPGAFAFAYENLRGDIFHAQGDLEAARTAWQRASMLAATLDSPLTDPLLEMKLRDLPATAQEDS